MTIDISKTSQVSRRKFLISSAAAGGGLAIGLQASLLNKAFAQGAGTAAAAQGSEVGVWVVINPNDDVVIRIARSEMGQGTLTGLAQLVAEELECDWNKVSTEYPTPGQNVARGRAWGDFSTGGSRGIRGSQDYVRKGGAAARMMLIEAAAKEWGVPASECKAENSTITHAPSGRKTTYGKVADAASKLEVPKDIKLKDPKEWKIAGKPVKRLDTAPKLTGKQVYAIDVKLPGMLNAAIKDAPVFGSKIKSVDESKASAMPGVKKIVRVDDSAVAVVADTWWQANKALQALSIAYEDNPNSKVSSDTIAQRLKEGLDSQENVFVGNQAGDAAKTIAGAAKKVEATYSVPFINHACMEPMNCTARVTPEKAEVWVATQNGEDALATMASASGLPIAKCDVYKVHLGTGFGRRGRSDYVRQAVLIAKEMPGTPVKLIWSREEDQAHGTYRPIGMCRMTAALDDKGDLVGMHMRISAQSILAHLFPSRLENGKDPATFQGLNPKGPEGEFGYSIPNLLIDHAMRNSHVPVGFWRGVNNNQNAIWLECFMDEVAKAAGKDPLEFRRKLLANHPKHLAVLNAAVEKADYNKQLPAGVFRGIAQHMGYGSYCASVAEVSVDNRGKVKVHRLVVAVDSGHVVNPDQVTAQTQGSVVYGLGAAFYQENTIKDGQVVELNFDTFDCMRLEAMPPVEVVLVPSGGFWGGIGEPTISVAAPAVLNGIYAATGKPVRTLPLKNVKLRDA